MTPILSYASVFCQVASKLIFLLSFMGGDLSTTLQNAFLIYIVEQYSVNMPSIYFHLPAIKGEPFLRSFSFKDLNKTLVLCLFVCLFHLYLSLKLLHQKTAVALFRGP